MTGKNYCPNPAAKNNTTGFAPVNNAALSRVTTASSAWLRSTITTVTRNVAGTGDYFSFAPFTADLGNIAGQAWSATVQWAVPSAAYKIVVALVGIDASNNQTGNIQSIDYNPNTFAANTTLLTKLSGIAPANTRKIALYIYVAAAPQNNFFNFTAIRYDQESNNNLQYFDGDSSGWQWDGTNGNSTSSEAIVSKAVTESVAVTEGTAATLANISKADSAVISDVINLLTTTQSKSESIAITETATVVASVVSTDNVLILDQVSGYGISKEAAESVALTDQITSLIATQTRSETLAITETSSVVVAEDSADSIAITETSKITQTQSENITITDESTLNQNKSEIVAITEDASLSQIASEEIEIIDTAVVEISSADTIIVDDNVGDRIFSAAENTAVVDNVRRLFVPLTAHDEFGIVDESAQVQEVTIRHDDIIDYTARDEEQRYRVLAQNMLTGEWIHNALPVTITGENFPVGAPNSISMEINTEIPSILDLDPPLREGGTWIYVEQDGEISATYMLDAYGDDNVAQKRTLTATGFSNYLAELEYTGDVYKRIQIDPADIVRYLWEHAQSYKDGNLGILVNTETTTPVRVGTEQEDVAFETGAGESVAFEAGPYDLNWWEVTNLGTEFNKLMAETPMEYVERSWWSEGKERVIKFVDFKYPRVGIVRDPSNVVFRQGENMIQPIPAFQRSADHLVTDVIVVGAGEGRSAIRGYASRRIGTRRKTKTIENEDITRRDRAQAIADWEMKRIARGLYYIDKIVVNTAHENARWGEWERGDDVWIEGKAKWVGKFSGYFRILNIELDRKTRYAMLSVAPSESFSYGALG